MTDVNIAIVGAGIAGLTAAIALRRAGVEVTVFEAADALGEIGAGVTLAPNAMRGLDYIGVVDAVVAAGIEPAMQRIAHWEDGRGLLDVDRSDTRARYGIPYAYIHRADLHEILVGALEAAGGTLRLGMRLDEVDCSGEQAIMCFADGSRISARLVIGADGLKSRVRRVFEPAPAHFTGHIAYRALAPVTEDIAPLRDLPGIHIGPGKMVVRYPMRAGTLLNLVFFARESGWTEDGWSIRAERSELEALYPDWCEDVQRLIAGLDPATLHKWAINAHSPLPHWTLKDQVTLIGDAAHAMTPFLGQGAAMGIEDAIVLSRALASTDDYAAALARYERVRRDRTHFVQHESNLNADRLQGQDTDMFGLGSLRNEETMGLFDYDCRSVAL